MNDKKRSLEDAGDDDDWRFVATRNNDGAGTKTKTSLITLV